MQTLGAYQITGEIGRGGCGIVYSALDPRIGRKVAIKTIVDAKGNAALGENLRERFRREARAAGGLSHPNIVTIHEFDDAGEILYIVMEFVEGRSLAERLTGAPLPRAFALSVLTAAADALDYAHARNIVHRDVKPGNFLIGDDGRLKIADFGIAKISDEETNITGTGAVIGTAQYMSPEQVFAKPVTGRSDQFSLAVVAFEMLTGKRPFRGDSWGSILHQIANTDLTAMNEQSEQLGAAASAVLRKALSKDPEQRYGSCREFADQLSRALAESNSRAADLATATFRYPVQRPAAPRLRARQIGAGGLAAVALIGGGIFYFSRSRQPQATNVVQVVPQPSQPTPAAVPPVATPEAVQPAPAKSRPPRTVETPAPVPDRPPVQIATATATPNPAQQSAPAAAVTPLPTPAPPPPTPVQEPPPPKPAPSPAPAAPARPTEAEAWGRIAASSDIAALQQFRKDYPNGSYADQAQQRIEQVEWDRARRAGDAKSIRDFLAKYPSSGLAPSARAELAKLDQAAEASAARTAISAALSRYRQAFENKDTEGLKAVWPGLSRAELSSFQSFFGIARSITLELQPLADPVLSSSGATLRCRRIVRASDNRGPLPVQDQVVNIHFIKSGDGMAIQSIDVSGR